MPTPSARRLVDIPASMRAALSDGSRASATLVEALAVDFNTLWRTVLPERPLVFPEGLGITRRMALAGQALATHGDTETLARLAAHPSDTVRGWVAYAWCASAPALPFSRRHLTLLEPLMVDTHFGVREWAWLALRPHIAADVTGALTALAPLSQAAHPFLRRFASESTRPRGVWCAHLPLLKQQPMLALPLLEPLVNDGHRYVQDSLANWLHDAGKDNPSWVRERCAHWKTQYGETPSLRYLVKRALR
jgi:3-methyladenine DNA glycosylase AlkC